ncbi:MAG: SUMF1/EgtB/PvdO family nonheme iron enzyme, partial [Desulfobacterales bacterium]|nr:SUMF1/EgtB/PvdO family nonheme iron enzyme [Desulfobacterales bacterium]
MGSPPDEIGRDPDEGPMHEVCVDGFWMGQTEVTNAQYRKFKPQYDSKSYHGYSLNGDDQ